MRSGGVGASNAGDSAWSRYRALAARDRRERLVVRVLLASGAGVVTAGLAAGSGLWWAGPAVALAVFAGQAVYARVRPGAATNWRRGAVAERRTGRRLARLDPAAFHVLHDRALPGSPANLDHLVVGLTGVYAVASRRWRPGVRLRPERGRLRAGGRPAGNVCGPAVRAAVMVGELLSAELDREIEVMAMVAVHGARVPRGGLWHGTEPAAEPEPEPGQEPGQGVEPGPGQGPGAVEFQSVRALARVITGRPVIYTSAQVATIAAAAQNLLPPMVGPALPGMGAFPSDDEPAQQ